MLAFLGWMVSQFVHLPGDIYAESNPLKALTTVPFLSHIQIFLCESCVCVCGLVNRLLLSLWRWIDTCVGHRARAVPPLFWVSTIPLMDNLHCFAHV